MRVRTLQFRKSARFSCLHEIPRRRRARTLVGLMVHCSMPQKCPYVHPGLHTAKNIQPRSSPGKRWRSSVGHTYSPAARSCALEGWRRRVRLRPGLILCSLLLPNDFLCCLDGFVAPGTPWGDPRPTILPTERSRRDAEREPPSAVPASPVTVRGEAWS